MTNTLPVQLETKATAELQQEIDDELKVDDPSAEKAMAVIEDASEAVDEDTRTSD